MVVVSTAAQVTAMQPELYVIVTVPASVGSPAIGPER